MPSRLEALFANRFVHRVLHKTAFGAVLAASAAWSAMQALALALAPAAAPAPRADWEWPAQWDGAPLRPLAPTAVEQRFARRFPGALLRATDGRRALVLRHVDAPTRMLHPAADCYRALGWRIAGPGLERDAQQRHWRCFTARRDGSVPLRVCERITDARGQAFTDTSAWYWAAQRGRSTGPWLAVTTAQPVP
ncbi:hypothetical protein [Pseudorhodoferax sp.]|uniref:hypothetical protein n=1 Tax=Pseudorhodoferax sp. TaxID=1993553 RepID=UPI0039E5C5D5